MKIGIMGGTFDPVHLGHLIAAETAREGMQLDEVWFVPAFIAPHKSAMPAANAEQRYEMLTYALQNHPQFRAEDYELKQKKVSYTVNTAAALRQIYPNDDFYWIIGADMVQYLPLFYKIDELLELISFIGMNRSGFKLDWDALPVTIQSKVEMLTMPNIEISSSDIRIRRGNGLSIKYLVPERVRIYIEENQLYES